MRARPLLAAVLAALLLGGCVDGEGAQQQQPSGTDDGLRATGLLDGARVAISRGNPIVVDGDCDPNQGLDEDLCILVRTIDGLELNLVVENPALLVPGAVLEVDERDCGDTGCDDVDDVLVLELRVDGVPRPVERGRVEVSQADDERVAAQFDLFLSAGDRLTGEFDIALPAAPVIIGPDGLPTETDDG